MVAGRAWRAGHSCCLADVGRSGLRTACGDAAPGGGHNGDGDVGGVHHGVADVSDAAQARSFVEGLGLYDSVLTYDEVDKLAQVPSAYVDMSGNRQVLAAVHHHLGDNVVNSCGVGATHWEARDGEEPASLPGARPTMFFAPSQIMKRHEELGGAVYQQQIAEATVNLNGGEIHASSEHQDMYAAIDGLIDKLDRQVIKHKEKLKRH